MSPELFDGAEAGAPDGSDLRELRAELPVQVRFGTSSWTYPGWQGLVYHRPYPKTGAAARMLEEYARFPLFGTVGIDSSFYTPPTPDTLARYAEHLPAGFPCVSKVWDELTVHTHTKAKNPARAGQRNAGFLEPELFLEAVYEPYRAHFRDHMGPFVFEFQTIARGSGLDPQAFADRLDGFFAALPRDALYAVELRNEAFLTPAYFAVLREHGVAHVFNSWTRMPSIGAQLDLPGAVTAPFLVARALLKPGRTYDQAVDAFAPYDRIREPLPELRADLVRLVEAARTLAVPAYILVNNRAEGSAPRTIEAVARLYAERHAGGAGGAGGAAAPTPQRAR
ncbi:MAG TPA: DUF72 domain-containing protein [Gemmatimonadales bacterium]|nr:DUF72 domain-containing protein [Gemmatimonadales bacterium]